MTMMMAQLNPADETLWRGQLARKGYATCTNPACRSAVINSFAPIDVAQPFLVQVMLSLFGGDGGTSQELSRVDSRGGLCVLYPLRHEIQAIPLLPDTCGEATPPPIQRGGARQ